ncbi:MAG: TonB-dependent receptor plug domain-containing protein [Polyangiaceae bacterium]|nr:TonB-dependent receptor plug domain-containing protein [Polyangiaceae bacterium]
MPPFSPISAQLPRLRPRPSLLLGFLGDLWCATLFTLGLAQAAPNAPDPHPQAGSSPALVSTSPNAVHPPSITPPSPIQAISQYPEGATGSSVVELELIVSATGEVVLARAVRGAPPFTGAAEEQALRWKFVPAIQAGKPVAAKIRYEVRFEQAPPSEPTAAPKGEQGSDSTALARAAEARPLEVTVLGADVPADTSSVSRAEARQLPGAFCDPFRAIESLPGVTSVVSGLPFFFIRGAPPGNVGYFIDGVSVPLLFHAFLGPQVIHPSLIERVDLYRGGPPAELGRYAGAIISSKTTPPPPRFGGEASVRVLDAGGLVHAPFANGNGQMLLAGRYSYTGLIASLFTDASIAYWDYQARTDYKLTSQNSIGVFAFGAYDYFADNNRDFAGTEFHRVDLRHTGHFDASTKLESAVTLGIDRSRTTLGYLVDRTLRARSALSTDFADNASFTLGGDAALDFFVLNVGRDAANYADLKALFPTRMDATYAAFAETEWRLGRVRVTPGIRVDRYHSLGQTELGVDPRISAVYQLTPESSLFQSLGLLHQPPSFLPAVPGARVAGLKGGLQSSAQHSFGAKTHLPLQITGTATTFQSIFFDLNDPLGTMGQADVDAESRDSRALGRAVGLELDLRRALTERLSGQLSYTLSRTTRAYGKSEGVSAFDRTHVANFGIGYRFDRGYQLGGRGVFYTGVPTRRLTDDGPRYDSADRASSFFRLDLRAEKRWVLGPNRDIGVHLEVFNATLNKEVVRRECGPRSCESTVAGPFTIPNIGVDATF